MRDKSEPEHNELKVNSLLGIGLGFVLGYMGGYTLTWVIGLACFGLLLLILLFLH